MSLHNRIIRQTTSIKNSVFRLLDASAILTGLFFTMAWYPGADSKATIVTFMAAFGIYTLVAEFTAMYRNWQAVSTQRELTCSVITNVVAYGLLSVLGTISLYTSELSTYFLLTWFASTATMAVVVRIAVRWFTRFFIEHGLFCRGCAIVGVNDLGIQLARNIQARPDLGLRFTGFYDDRPDERTSEIPKDLDARLGRIAELVEDARQGKVHKIFIALPMRAEDRIRAVLEQLSDTTASVYVAPDFFVFQLLHSRWTDVQGLPVVSIFENPFYGVDGVLKRTTDLAFGSLAIALFSIPMAAIALLVKLSSPGPILFRQKRYGLDGQEIKVWKFRTMRVCENGATVTQAQKEDPRITPVGRILRKTSLDELPQLFNVIMGSMSLVGPRPHASAHNEQYRKQIDGYMLRHKVKPGITGLAQVNGCRGETDTLDKMEGRIHFDHRYIREWSWWLDLQILFRTIAVVWKQENAY